MAGPPPQEQIDSTLHWVTDVFRDHYRAAPPPMPPRYARREFGFLWTGKKFFLRHVGFSSPRAFQEFMVKDAPHHAYYSTAYYKTPHASTMKEKEWLGADLIFDLDADHLPGAESMSFAEQLRAVHKQARKLLDEFLLGDLGFDRDHVRVVFSGGRGYHFHVSDPRVLSLDSAARREIVDYISPNEMVRESLFNDWHRERTVVKSKFGDSKETVVRPATAAGWNGRITRTMISYLENLLRVPEEDAVKDLCRFDGIGPQTARSVLKWATPEKLETLRTGQLSENRPGDFMRKMSIERKSRLSEEWIFLPPALQRKVVFDAMIESVEGLAPGETDEPVTADIKRLIRLPGSLHGKTGLRVTPLTIDEFASFDPLKSAVALGDEPTRVVVSKPIDVPLHGFVKRVEPGEQELPLFAAMFVVLRRSALRRYEGPEPARAPAPG